jgi:DHA2 family multidrug resistance protein
VPDASRLFDLMRNLGGAIGLALIDTVIYGRLLFLGAAIRDRLQAGDFATAKSVGLPLDIFAQRPAGPLDAGAPSNAGATRRTGGVGRKPSTKPGPSSPR